MKLPFIIFCLFGINSVFAAETKKFESPAGFYTISYPSDWKVSTEENIVNIVPTDGRGAVTISAFYSKNGDMNPFLEMMQQLFAKSEPVAKFHSYEKTPLSGIEGEFREKDGETLHRWIVRGVHNKQVFVLITANEPDATFSRRKTEYLSILDSLALKEPKEG
jgi:hypothetical protein